MNCLLYLELKLPESLEAEPIVIRFLLLKLPYSFKQFKDLFLDDVVAAELDANRGELQRGLVEFYGGRRRQCDLLCDAWPSLSVQLLELQIF